MVDSQFVKPSHFEVLDPIFSDVVKEMNHAREKGWSQDHDDKGGSGHLVGEAVYRLTHMGEYPTDEFVDHELTVAIGLLVNAKLTLVRALDSGHTFTVDGVTGHNVEVEGFSEDSHI
jgi:hypothetical protein